MGYGHIIAVTYEHTVYSWGDNGHGQLGHGDTMARSSPQLVETLKGRPILRYIRRMCTEPSAVWKTF